MRYIRSSADKRGSVNGDHDTHIIAFKTGLGTLDAPKRTNSVTQPFMHMEQIILIKDDPGAYHGANVVSAKEHAQ